MSAQSHDPAAFLTGDQDKNDALVILNQPILNGKLFERAWAHCKLRVCADGGANQLYDYLSDPTRRQEYLPDFITGDLDSLRDDVKKYYSDLGVDVIHNPDQYSTDFMKATQLVSKRGKYGILAYGAMGGRVDQSFHSIHHLFLSYQQGQTAYLLSDQSITFLLQPGKSSLRTPHEYLGKTCGIIPISGPCKITTSGLEWDVEDWETGFDSQVSTSNHLVEDAISVECDKPVLFTAELRPLV